MEHYELTGAFSTLAIPATLQDSLMARLDRLVTAKAVAQYAAVIGRQFSYELLQAVSQRGRGDVTARVRKVGRSGDWCTNEVYHPKQPTSSNTPLFRMQRMSRF